jgi:allantoicase
MNPWIDLVSRRIGGVALLANDEFFAPKENLIAPGRGVFREDEYTDRGKWMDGWETRRRRDTGYDWCILRLGARGVIHEVTVDTNHFRGNHPESCSLDACDASAMTDARELSGWTEILPRTPLAGHAENRFTIASDAPWSYVRLNIFPDGGVARLRVSGVARPRWRELVHDHESIDLASAVHGALPVACSDQFFSEPANLLMPGRSESMGDGWETRRRRGPGFDWVVLRLACRGLVERILVDTNHFKGNFPESCRLLGWDETQDGPLSTTGNPPWREIVPRRALRAHDLHTFDELAESSPITHVRLEIFPDGGVSRLRVFGRPDGAVA